jgi:hypothetical protein
VTPVRRVSATSRGLLGLPRSVSPPPLAGIVLVDLALQGRWRRRLHRCCASCSRSWGSSTFGPLSPPCRATRRRPATTVEPPVDAHLPFEAFTLHGCLRSPARPTRTADR